MDSNRTGSGRIDRSIPNDPDSRGPVSDSRQGVPLADYRVLTEVHTRHIKVASGGELSRLMLSIKSLVASSVSMPTLIFDEIDSGISGEAARQVGILMKELGESHQVISITHQPQIAARADTHFYVFKKELNKKIHTQIKKLDPQERVEAIAKMMGGEKPSALVMENAREMVMNN